jgi:hypothetical protein
LRFKRRSVAWSLTACSAVFLLVGLSGLITEPVGNGSFLFALGLTVLSAVLVVRTFRMATIIVTGGMTIAIHTVDGRRIVAGEFWSLTARSGKSPRIDAIVRELNERGMAPTANASPEVIGQVGSKGSP